MNGLRSDVVGSGRMDLSDLHSNSGRFDIGV